MSIKQICKYGGWIILTVILVSISITMLIFPSEEDIQTLIRKASSIELQYIPAPNYTTYFVMATISSANRTAIEQLSKSIDFHGVWLPFIEVSGNVYRCRVTKDDGSWEDIVLLGSEKIKYGNWCIAVSSTTLALLKKLVIENGGHLPSNEILLKMLKAKKGSKLFYNPKNGQIVIEETK
jgi:hypothetical protein